MRFRYGVILAAGAALFLACGGDDNVGPIADGGPDSIGADGSLPGFDASNDAPSADTGPIDAAADAGADAAKDSAAADAAPDTGVDAAAADAAVDASSADASDASSIVDANIPDVSVFDSGACNALVNDGNAVPETQIAAAAPSGGAGGTIALGTYHLIKWETYTGVGGTTGPTGNTRKTAFLFKSSTTYLKVTADNGLSNENDNRTWTTQGTTLYSNQYCPSTDNLSSDYTATPTSLVLFAGTEVLTFSHP